MDASKEKSFTIDFDDVEITGGPIRGLPRSYDDLLWKGWNVFNSKYGPLQGSGYDYGCTSGTQAASSNGDQPCSVFLKNGSFTLESLELTAGWDKKLTVDIYGYRQGEVVYHETVHLTDKAPLDVHLDFEDVDNVKFVQSHGKPDDLIGSGDNMIFDDMVFKDVQKHASADHLHAAPAEHPIHLAAPELLHPAMHALA